MRNVFITGGTGYIGSRLIPQLVQRGHHVTALVREGSQHKLPPGAQAVVASPFDAATFQSYISTGAVFVQLLGVAHPSPKKAQQFKDVDLRSVKASADAAANAGVSNFIYVSVSMAPSRLMKAFQEVKGEGESYCIGKGFNCTFIRPWYILGPRHWWPVLLLPLYGIAEIFPSLRQKARARALVTIHQMVHLLVKAVEEPPAPIRVLEIPQIRKGVVAV